jgi:hypothetical protein
MISELQQHLEFARQLQYSRLTYGVDGIRQFVNDVDGDWLETWRDDDMKINYVSAIYYDFDKQLVVTTNFEHIVITVSGVTEEQAKDFMYNLNYNIEVYVVPKRKDGYKLNEFGLGK